MKIVVAIKAVAALDDEFELVDGGAAVDPDFLEWELNEWDAFSLEAALELREPGGEGEVLAITVGDEDAQEALLGCLAKGADRGVRIWDDALAGADTMTVARVLAAAVARESPDLVLCGVQSSDAAGAATGIALAGLLDLAHVAVVTHIEHDAPSATLTVERELEGGLVEVLRLATPALLTIQTGINQPRYATLRAIKQAREKPIALEDLAGLGLDAAQLSAAAGSQRRALVTPDRGGTAEMLAGSPAELARRIAELVRARAA